MNARHPIEVPPAPAETVRVPGSAPQPQPIVTERTRALIENRRLGATHRRGWIIRRALVAADVFGILGAFSIAETLFYNPSYAIGAEIILFIVTLPAWLLLANLYELYDRDETRTDHSTTDELFAVFNMLTVGTFVFVAITYLFPELASVPLRKVLAFWMLAIILVVAARSLARTICRRSDAYLQNTVIVGAGYVGQRLAVKLLHHPEYGVNLLGFVDELPREREDLLAELTILGDPKDLLEIVRQYDIERVIVAFSHQRHAKTLALVRDLNQLDVQVDIVPRLFEVIGPHATVHAAEGLPLVGLAPVRFPRSALALKRSLDLVVSALGLILLCPLFVCAAVAIKLDSQGPIFFRQTRVGRGDRPFKILKFRTMVADAEKRKNELVHLNKHRGGDERMFKVHDDPRITRVGKALRRGSFDEFPQLWNVLRGQMSLVGPRPLIPEEHDHVNGWARRRLDLKPGMTGLWQVLGRDDIPFGEMIGLDYRYVTTWSLARDLKLMLKTIAVLTHSSG